MRLNYRRFKRIEFVPIDDSEESVLIFPTGRGLLPELITLETLARARNTVLEELVRSSEIKMLMFWTYMYDEIVFVRNRFARPVWVFLFRLDESGALTRAYIIRFLMIWGLARFEEYVHPSWQHIRPIGWLANKVRRH